MQHALKRVPRKKGVVCIRVALEREAALSASERVEVKPRIPVEHFPDNLGSALMIRSGSSGIIREPRYRRGCP